MKKYLLLLIVSFLFFVPKTYAATHNITFSSSEYDILLNSNFTSLMSTLHNSPYYVVAKDNTGNTYYASINLTTISDYVCTWNLSRLMCTNTRRQYKQFFNPTTFENTTTGTSELTNYHFGSMGYIYYTNIPLIVNNGDTYNITDGTNTWSCTGTTSSPCAVPDLLTFYNMYHDPIGIDDYPVLTNFYSLVIDKISYITEEFASNYIYLSIFVVFLLIFILELIKRRVL